MAKREADLDLGRLCIAMQKARITLRRAREERREAVREYIGRHYSEEGTPHRVPINLLSLYVSIVSRNLIAKNPRVLLSTFNQQAKATVSAMQQWANDQIDKVNLAATLQRIVTDALFSIGICKVGLASPAEAALSGWQRRPGEPFAMSIDLDDFVFDIHARSFEEAGYIGHRYRAPLDAIKKMFGKRAKELIATEDRLYNLEGDERISVLSRGYYSNQEEYEDFVDLWEVWLPRHRRIVTLYDGYLVGTANYEQTEITAKGGEYRARALSEQKWIGPDRGPYLILAMGTVPGSAMPKAPVQDLIDLHMAVNNAARKLVRETENFKSVVGVSGGVMEDGERLRQANDGELFKCDRPDALKVLEFGGPNQQVFAIMGAMKEMFSQLGGNLEIMGGLSPQSKTAHQDEMLNQNSSRTIADMQDRTVTFTADLLDSLCWYWHHHPQKVMRSSHSLPGLPDMAIERAVTPEQRQTIPYDALRVKVDPYSMQHATPQARAQALQQVFQQVVIPLGQLLQSQGIQVDMHKFLAKMAEYMDMPDLAEILVYREPPQDDTSGGPGSAGPKKPPMPAQTSREYVRRSLGQEAPGAKQNQFETMMAQGAPNGQANGQG